MGYRSEVHSLVYGPEDLVHAAVAAWQVSGGFDIFRVFGDSIRRGRINATIMHEGSIDCRQVGAIELYGPGWKWYDGYADVIAWHEFLDHCGAEPFSLATEFVRIGEETADIETTYNEHVMDAMLSVSSSITSEVTEWDEAQ